MSAAVPSFIAIEVSPPTLTSPESVRFPAATVTVRLPEALVDPRSRPDASTSPMAAPVAVTVPKSFPASFNVTLAPDALMVVVPDTSDGPLSVNAAPTVRVRAATGPPAPSSTPPRTRAPASTTVTVLVVVAAAAKVGKLFPALSMVIGAPARVVVNEAVPAATTTDAPTASVIAPPADTVSPV